MEYMLEKLQHKYVINLIGRLLRKGGSIVSNEHAAARKEICLKCPHFGKVSVLGLEFKDGDKLCGCPLATKAKQDILMRHPDNIGKAINPSELLLSPILGKKYVPEKNICTNSNPNYKSKGATGEDYWKEVDNKFFNKTNKK